MAPAATLIVAEPAVAPVTAPQVLARFGVAATCMPAGNASLKARPVRLSALLLVTVIVRREVAPAGTLAGANDFVSVGLLVKVATAAAVAPVPPLADETVPVVLVYALAAAEVTETVTVQLALAASVPPLTPTVLPPATPPLSVPPGHVVAALGVAAFTSPAG